MKNEANEKLKWYEAIALFIGIIFGGLIFIGLLAMTFSPV